MQIKTCLFLHTSQSANVNIQVNVINSFVSEMAICMQRKIN